MLFNSVAYVAFFAASVVIFYLVPGRFRWFFLLAASLLFYAAWDARLLALMFAVIAVTYAASFFISREQKISNRKKWLLLACLVNFGALFAFKYVNFFAGALRGFFPIPEFNIILPMAISFYTFQAMGYAVDVYRNEYKHERNFLKFSLFITFFPQLVAGPIERARFLLPQLLESKVFKKENFVVGAKFLILGYFKKVVIADRIAPIVNAVYGSPRGFAGLPLLIATLLFSLQIYCDFSGYSDIAVGCAKFFDIDLTLNFRQPYFSKGIREFWRRWHITLSAWFKDYVYFPLGGSRVSKPRHYFNTMVTFLVSGLWHGANFTFVLWGAIHGASQIIGDAAAGLARRLRAGKVSKPENDPKKPSGDKKNPRRVAADAVKIIFTFSLVTFAWIFFRADTIGDAFYITAHLFDGAARWTEAAYVYDVLFRIGPAGTELTELFVIACAALLLAALEVFSGKGGNTKRPGTVHDMLAKKGAAVRWGVYTLLCMAIISAGVYGNAGAFIYFQF